MKKIRFNNVVQVKYFNKDDIIKKNGYTIYYKMRCFLFFIVICLLFYYFYRSFNLYLHNINTYISINHILIWQTYIYI